MSQLLCYDLHVQVLEVPVEGVDFFYPQFSHPEVCKGIVNAHALIPCDEQAAQVVFGSYRKNGL